MILCNGDDPVALEIASKAFCPVERFGLTDGAEWTASEISNDDRETTFMVIHNGIPQGRVSVRFSESTMS